MPAIETSKVINAIHEYTPDIGARGTAYAMWQGWLRRFGPDDATYKILHVEPELLYALDDSTILLGRLDLIAQRSDGEIFFGDWKTAKANKQKFGWVHEWIMSHQALTYGLLSQRGSVVSQHRDAINSLHLGTAISKFHVRYAFKPSSAIQPVSNSMFECEWFTFTPSEIAFWERQVLSIADKIRALRRAGTAQPWTPNFDHCNRYGKEYQCDYFKSCSQLVFSFAQDNASEYQRRISHLQTERKLFEWGLAKPSQDLVVLDSSRITQFLNCNELYKKQYELNLVPLDPNSKRQAALDTGGALHAGLENYYRQLQGVI